MTNESKAQASVELNAKIYPVSSSTDYELKTESSRNVGVCFSGGGSRALSAALGALRGLNQQGWIDQIGTISGVSGGCWASSLYIFLPSHISYNDFLGTGVMPNLLQWDCGNVPKSLSFLTPNNLGNVPTRLGFDELYNVYKQLDNKGFKDWHQLWRIAIGELVFKHYGLYDPDANHNPTTYYSWSETYFDRTISPKNPNLSASDFRFARNEWPWLIMNGSMFYPKNANSLVPVVSNFFCSGIRGTFPQVGQSGSAVGGGFVDTFGMGSQFLSQTGEQDRVNIQQPRPISVVDMASISSAAYAEEFRKRYGVDDVELQYNYWPVTGGGSAGEVYQFADGGLLENAGLANLLANTKLTKVVAFVNSSQKVEHNDETWKYTQVPDTIPPLFGYQPIKGIFDDDGYKPYAGASDPKDPLMKHNQVFPSNRFQELLDGLKNAYNDFEDTAMFYQEGLKLQENSWFGISSSDMRSVDVLWVCNNRVNSWEKQITDSAIKDYLDVRDLPDTALWNFPYYDTLLQLHLSKQQVNMLAQLSWWNVIADQNQGNWKKIFG